MKENRIETWLQSRSYLQALILDALIDKDEKTFQDIFDYAIKFYSKFHNKLPAVLIFVYLKELDNLGLVEITKIPEDPNDFNMFNLKGAFCRITDSGLTAIRNQSFHGVATSAFLDKQAIILSRRVLILSILTIILALISIFISVSSSKVEKSKYESLINSIESNYKGEPIVIKIDSIQFNTLFKIHHKVDSGGIE